MMPIKTNSGIAGRAGRMRPTCSFLQLSAELSEPRPIISRQSIDLGRRELRGDCPHAPVHVVASLARGIHLQLQHYVFLSLLGENGRLDRAARAGPMARGAGRDIAVRIA